MVLMNLSKATSGASTRLMDFFNWFMFLCFFQRISETLDVEIKRWSAGKEGNVRALLSTMQYVCLTHPWMKSFSSTDIVLDA